jgi:hypothetical protein
MVKWITFALILFVSCFFGVFGRILEHFVNFLKWPEKKFEVIFRSIVCPFLPFPTELWSTTMEICDASFHCSIFTGPSLKVICKAF